MIKLCVIYAPNFSLLSFSFVNFLFQTCSPAILPPLKVIYPGNIIDDLGGTFHLSTGDPIFYINWPLVVGEI